MVIIEHAMNFATTTTTTPRHDNPAAEESFPVRHLTHAFLLPLNFWLLLNPKDLLCDWTQGTVPLVASFWELRNLATVSFFFLIIALTRKSMKESICHQNHVLIMSLSLLVFPFIPASNLFFSVGFVIAGQTKFMHLTATNSQESKTFSLVS